MTSKGTDAAGAGQVGAEGAPVEEKLDGIVFLHPSVRTIRDPKHGYALAWDPAWRKLNFLIRLLSWYPKSCRLGLDQVGKRVVELIDGKRSIRIIADQLAKEFGWSKDKSREALLLFLSALMSRNVIQVVRAGSASAAWIDSPK